MIRLDSYPGIKKAALLIGYDNGIIDRDFTEADFLISTQHVLNDESETILAHIDIFLSGLTGYALTTLCCGDEQSSKSICNRFMFPDILQELLNTIFEQ